MRKRRCLGKLVKIGTKKRWDIDRGIVEKIEILHAAEIVDGSEDKVKIAVGKRLFGLLGIVHRLAELQSAEHLQLAFKLSLRFTDIADRLRDQTVKAAEFAVLAAVDKRRFTVVGDRQRR